MFVRYGLAKTSAPFGFNEPALISIPLSFLTLVVVSLIWRKKAAQAAPPPGGGRACG